MGEAADGACVAPLQGHDGEGVSSPSLPGDTSFAPSAACPLTVASSGIKVVFRW